jgi:hypothetical protein
MGAGDEWNLPPSTDAVVAAPESHRVPFENEDVRVLGVTIVAGHREPEHTHRERRDPRDARTEGDGI